MSTGILVFGASGSGTTTIGKQLAKELNATHIDLDDIYWKGETEIPYTSSNSKEERIENLMSKIDSCDQFVLSGDMLGWEEPFLPLLDLAVFVYTPSDIRIKRLRKRELSKYGDRIVHGDMVQKHIEFLEWARQYDSSYPPMRCLKGHVDWIKIVPCTVLKIKGDDDLKQNIIKIKNKIKDVTS